MKTNRRVFILGIAGGVTSQLFVQRGLAQSTQTVGRPYGKSALVVATEGRTIYARNSTGPVTILVSANAKIWKGDYGASIDSIRSGDQVLTRGTDDLTGRYIATEVWVNITIVRGMISSIGGNGIFVTPMQPAQGRATEVLLNDRTLSNRDLPYNKDHIKIGRFIHVVGLALPDGTIRATRIFVSENGQPLDFEGTPIVDPLTGKLVNEVPK
jgi:hypothetical protein